MHPGQQPREFQRLSDTGGHVDTACRNLKARLSTVLRVLKEITLETSGARSVAARGLIAQIDRTFIGLHT